MGDDEQGFDFFQVLTEHAAHLNGINVPALSPSVFYDLMSGALVWSDERNSHTPTRAIWGLRPIVAYRTGLMVGKPRQEFQALWQHALSLFPYWVGFLPERRQPTPELLAIYRKGEVSVERCVRNPDAFLKSLEEGLSNPEE